MKMKRIKKSLSLILCIVLIVVMALFTIGCNDNENKETTATKEAVTTVKDSNVLGEGDSQFMFTVVDKEGNETEFEIHTDKKIVGEALLELDLIAGEDGDYGLYVKEVNGITADYETDGTYWAFYVNDEYATAGVDTTEIVEGSSYAFKVEK